jgi:chorismate-pyruvate lyase
MDARTCLELLLGESTTVTALLEHLVGEPVDARQLRHVRVPAVAPNLLDVPEGQLLLRRSAVLQGRESGRAYLRAESLLVTTRLRRSFTERLRTGHDPIGRIMTSEKLDYTRTLLPAQDREAVLAFLEPEESDSLLVRSYRLEVEDEPVMIIEESFLRSLEPFLTARPEAP